MLDHWKLMIISKYLFNTCMTRQVTGSDSVTAKYKLNWTYFQVQSIPRIPRVSNYLVYLWPRVWSPNFGHVFWTSRLQTFIVCLFILQNLFDTTVYLCDTTRISLSSLSSLPNLCVRTASSGFDELFKLRTHVKHRIQIKMIRHTSNFINFTGELAETTSYSWWLECRCILRRVRIGFLMMLIS